MKSKMKSKPEYLNPEFTKTLSYERQKEYTGGQPVKRNRR